MARIPDHPGKAATHAVVQGALQRSITRLAAPGPHDPDTAEKRRADVDRMAQAAVDWNPAA